MVKSMTSASVMAYRPELQEFLYAPLTVANGEAPISVLSALARLGLDPWEEASKLADLTVAAATVRLTAIIARLPASSRANADPSVIVSRLVLLLPPSSGVRLPGRSIPMSGKSQSNLLLAVVLAGLALAAAYMIYQNSTRGSYNDMPLASPASRL
jgi:hypothetical protein